MKVVRTQGRVREPQLVVPEGFAGARGSAKFLALVLVPAALCCAVLVLGMPIFLMAMLLSAMLGVTVLCATLVLPLRGTAAGTIRLAPSEPLRFASPAAPNFIWLAMALIVVSGFLFSFELLLGATTQRHLGIPESGGLLRYSGPAVLVMGLLGLGASLRGLRRPTGLTLSEDGVLGSGSLVEPIQVPWSALRGVTLAAEGKIKVVRLHNIHGFTHTLRPILLGSDPVIIAETIEYFRVHPDERTQLERPLDALALVIDRCKA